MRRQAPRRPSETGKATRWIPHNSREGVKEALLDVEEGADIVMVKPGSGLSGYDYEGERGHQRAGGSLQHQRRVRHGEGRGGQRLGGRGTDSL